MANESALPSTDELGLKIPLWGKVLVLFSKFLPIPPWLKAILPVIIGIIEALPKWQRTQAKEELVTASRDSVRQGSAQPLLPVVKKHCSGIGCPPNLVGDSARQSDWSR